MSMKMKVIDKYGRTELTSYINFGPIEKALCIIEAGVDLEQADVKGYTYLHMAAQDENPIIVKALLKNGANINAKTVTGATPLRIAVTRCKRFPVEQSLEVIKLLLDAGGDPNETINGVSTKDLATTSGIPEIKELVCGSN